MARFSKLEKVLAAAVGIDLVRPGTTRAAVTRLAAAMPQRAAATAVAPSAINPAMLAAAPYVVGAGLGYYGLQTEPGQDLLAASRESGREARVRYERALAEAMQTPADLQRAFESAPISVGQALGLGPTKKKRTLSDYNKAIKKGMSAVRKSKFGGKKGVLTNAKRTFGQVAKTASKISKGKKVSAKGVIGTIARAVRPTLKKRSPSKTKVTIRARGRDY
tara:strand:+ start:486 stop:1145 length:660 start_codon:yes stop_codon:yes gene_type:complete